jgi:hypothetical protein
MSGSRTFTCALNSRAGVDARTAIRGEPCGDDAPARPPATMKSLAGPSTTLHGPPASASPQPDRLVRSKPSTASGGVCSVSWLQ